MSLAIKRHRFTVVQVQNPIELAAEDSEPQPDITVLRPRDDFYTTAHPRAADVLLAIEVAETTVRLDRSVKVRCTPAPGSGKPGWWT